MLSPRQLVVMAELPRNQMGKTLRRKVAQVVRDARPRVAPSAARDSFPLMTEDQTTINRC